MVQPILYSLFREGRVQQLLELVKELHPADLVDSLHEFSLEEQEGFSSLIPHEQSAIIMQEMEVAGGRRCFGAVAGGDGSGDPERDVLRRSRGYPGGTPQGKSSKTPDADERSRRRKLKRLMAYEERYLRRADGHRICGYPGKPDRRRDPCLPAGKWRLPPRTPTIFM